MNRSLITAFVSALISIPALAGEDVQQRWIVQLHEPLSAVSLTDEPRAMSGRGVVLPIVSTQVDARLESLDMMVVNLRAGEAATLSDHPAVRFVEPDRPVKAFGTATFAPAAGPQEIPWGVAMVRAEQAWTLTRGEGVKLAVIDSGIDREHPEFLAGYRGGYDFIQNDSDPQDENGHGTHVAGTIAAADDGQGIVGVAPAVELYALRVLDKSGNGTVSGVVRAIDWAIQNEIDVINLSLGSAMSSESERAAFEKAEAAGIVAIAATGNGYPELAELSFPAGYPTVLSVGAVDRTSAIGGFSQRGTGIDVVAPGVSVDSTIPPALSTRVRVNAPGLSPIFRNLLEFSPSITAAKPLTGVVHYANRGLSDSDFTGAAGKIALIERGDAFFHEKVRRARTAGAVAAIIFNNSSDDADLAWTLGEPSATAFVPTVGVTQKEGQDLRALTGQNVTLTFDPQMVGANTGTSMASPHVAGVAALLRSLHPAATPFRIRQMIVDSAGDLGDFGYDLTHGWGLVDAERATLLPPTKSPRRGVRR